ncbi:MAG: glycosyltransferase family 2 protein [Acidobacteriota bacterium]
MADQTEANQAMGLTSISVGICTYKRQDLLEKLLRAVAAQKTEGLFAFSCVVVDNDEAGSARSLIDRLRNDLSLRIDYAVESTRNFALVRNRVVSLAAGDLLAFIDDDEVPRDDWLLRMLETLQASDADAVLGPVRPYFEGKPPSWVVKSRICERPAYPTGTMLHWRQTRTGNVLLRGSILREEGLKFDPAYGSGGEDVDFFRRAAEAGKKFVWCEEAPAYELVPASRLTRSYHLKRALHQGRVSLRYSMERPSLAARAGVAAQALTAAVLYTIALPFLFVAGEHLGMKYLIKDCHHLSRLGAMLGIGRSAQRNF